MLKHFSGIRILLFAAVMTSICLIAMTYSGFSQTDEVSYLDPGVNLATGGGFHSTAWGQSPETTWGSSNPVMPLLYAGWFKLVGFGKLQSRTLSVILHFAGLFALVAWVRRRMALSAGMSLLLYLCLTTMPVLVWTGVSCRLEVFALLFFTWFLAVAFPDEPPSWPRRFSALAFGMLTLLTGLHFAGYFAACFGALFLLRRDRETFLRGLWVAIGMAFGGLVLWRAYSAAGAWEAFMLSRGSHYDGRPMEWVPTGWRMFFVSRDISALGAVVLASLAYTQFRAKEGTGALRLDLVRALGVFIAVPLAMNAMGIFYVSYAWMIALPVIVMLVPHLGRLPTPSPRATLGAFAVLSVAYLAAVGYRLRHDFQVHGQQAAVADFVLSRASVADPIAASNELYYVFKPAHPDVRVQPQMPGWPPRMYDELRWAVARSDDIGRIIKNRFSEWEEVARFPMGAADGPRADDYVALRRLPR